MDTYKINAQWDSFKEFVINELQGYKSSLGFMYRPNEIYMRTLDDSVLEIIKKKYQFILSDQPSNFLDRDWTYFGEKFFNIIP